MEGLKSIQSLFGETAFRIPPYQRGYAWETQQWEELLEDIEVLPDDKDHFGGPVVLYPTDEAISDQEGTVHRVCDVVDGQQRITTVILALEAMRRLVDGALADGISKRYLWITDAAAQRKPKLQFSDGTQDYFERNVLADTPAPGGATTKAQERLSEGLRHFEGYLRERAASDPRALRDFHDRLTQHFKVSVLEVQDRKEVGLIFEVLNSRGRPLSQLDLVKNYVLYVGTKLDLAEHDLDDDVANAWARTLSVLMEAGVGSPSHEDQLLRAHWLMAYDYQKKAWKRSHSVKTHFRRRNYEGRHTELLADLTQFVRTLTDAAVAYSDIYAPAGRAAAFREFSDNQATRGRIIRASERLNRTRAVAVFLPLLIATRLTVAGDSEKYLAIVEAAERYAFRVYRLLGRRADAGESTIARIANDLYAGRITFEAALGEFKSVLLYYCPDDRFRAAFELQERNDWYHWSGIKYLLYEYEQHLVGADAVRLHWEEVERLDREKTIEHILPQTPTADYWLERFDGEAQTRYTHDLGNLVLTADNSSYRNKPFPEKKGRSTSSIPCYETSNLKSERQIAADFDDWTIDAIIERRQRIVTWALDRWAVAGATGTDEPPANELVVDAEDEETGDVTAATT